MTEASRSAVEEMRVPVWDPVVRIGHWTLVVAFAVAYLTAEEETGSLNVFHVWGGYVVGAIVALRVLWGFVGPRYARFTDFIRGPITALGYLVDLILGRARRYVGHSPAGGAMVIALLACLAATAATGVIAYGEAGKRPLAAEATIVVNAAYAVENEGGRNAVGAEGSKGRESAVAELHDALANITLALVILHVLGVGLASYAHRENLVMAMVSGKKRAAE
jgi:cytochrome b